jgi:hypothetical protein
VSQSQTKARALAPGRPLQKAASLVADCQSGHSSSWNGGRENRHSRRAGDQVRGRRRWDVDHSKASAADRGEQRSLIDRHQDEELRSLRNCVEKVTLRITCLQPANPSHAVAETSKSVRTLQTAEEDNRPALWSPKWISSLSNGGKKDRHPQSARDKVGGRRRHGRVHSKAR